MLILVQDDHGGRAALARHREVPLDASRVVVAIETGHEKRRIHVRREDLLGGLVPGRFPGEHTLPWQNSVNGDARGWRGASHGNPVANRRQVAPGASVMPETAGDFGQCFVFVQVDAKGGAIAHGDPRRAQPACSVRLERDGLPRRPTELFERHLTSS